MGVGPSFQYHALDSLDVDKIKGQGPTTSSLDRFVSMLGHQTHQLLSLPELAPRKGTFQKLLHEASRLRAYFSSLAYHPVGVPPRVGLEFWGIVLIVRLTFSGRFCRVRLDELPLAVDPYQRTVPAHGHLLAQVAGRHRIQGLEKPNVMVGMDFTFRPLRCVETLALERT